MAKESFGDRTHGATPRRREEARRQGQVARSPELGSALVLLAAMVALVGLGPALLMRLAQIQRALLSGMWIRIESPESAIFTFQKLSAESLLALAPFVLVLLAAGIVSNVAQVGFLFTTKPLAPKWSVLDPIQGFARKFGRRGAVELVKTIFKLAIIAGVAYLTLSANLGDLVPLIGADGGTLLSRVGHITVQLGTRVGLALLALAAFDYGYQRWEYEQSIRMSRKEIEEEQKQMEGDPHVKARVRGLQRQLSHNRMIASVAKADVVITNPVHVAIALQYDRATMAAPIVVARGLRKVAERIKEEARKHDVPIVEDPPLARLLYKESKLGEAVPVSVYRAVAQVLAHVWRLKEARRGGRRGNPRSPKAPRGGGDSRWRARR